ncbi:uncharacterized protein LOC134610520 [Pelobates fuscus]|uniref:uncharacterized protein LOC134610520 n=1 Tax=Pelobates fuscus TaxID=191477 RepID=UPI002FE46C21
MDKDESPGEALQATGSEKDNGMDPPGNSAPTRWEPPRTSNMAPNQNQRRNAAQLEKEPHFAGARIYAPTLQSKTNRSARPACLSATPTLLTQQSTRTHGTSRDASEEAADRLAGGSSGQGHTQLEEPGVMYAAIKKPKKNEVPTQHETSDLLYTDIKKPKKKNEKMISKLSGRQSAHEDIPVHEELPITYADINTANRPHEIPHSMALCFSGGKQDAVQKLQNWLVPGLFTICLILLVTIISISVTCAPNGGNYTTSNSGSSGSGDQSDPSPRCPPYWVEVDKKCYYFSEDKKPMNNSNKNCSDSGSRLATVTNSEDSLQWVLPKC